MDSKKGDKIMETKSMTIQEFADKYRMASESIYMFKKRGRLPNHVFTKVDGKRGVQIDEQYFLKRKTFQTKVIEFNQLMYYFHNLTQSDRGIARVFTNAYPTYNIVCFSSWLGRDLPKVKHSMMLVEVTQTHWDFFRHNRRILRALGMTIKQVKAKLK